ncbi:hypothetical protein ABJC35_07560, partial [Bifidobacterium longum]
MESISPGRADLLYVGRAGSHVRETGVSWAEPHNTPRNAHKVNYISDTPLPDVYLEVQHPCWSCNSNS